MAVQPIPAGHPRVSPYLCVVGAPAALAWYAGVLGAEETVRIPSHDGGVMHAEIRIGESVVMLGEQAPAHGAFAPGHYGGTAVSLVVYVEDVDALSARAAAAGATIERPPADQPYGDRTCTILDPFGHRWHLASHVEDVAAEEIVRRMSGAG